jgi:hypothetical protein
VFLNLSLVFPFVFHVMLLVIHFLLDFLNRINQYFRIKESLQKVDIDFKNTKNAIRSLNFLTQHLKTIKFELINNISKSLNLLMQHLKNIKFELIKTTPQKHKVFKTY